jgi:aspartyl/asparaginyl beta-hydroxylase (cupin superfamily)
MTSLATGNISSLNCTSGFLSPSEEYPDVHDLLLKNEGMILEELVQLLSVEEGRKWGVWAAEDYDPPKFTLLTPEEILERQERIVEDPERNHQWSLYGLHLYGNPIDKGVKSCPKTSEMLSRIPGLINAGFSCLGPNSETGWHEDVDRGFDRLHLSLIIPKGDCTFQVGSEQKQWSKNKVICFDDTFWHNAWNKTDFARYVLLVDVKRNPFRTETMSLRASNLEDSNKFFDWRSTFGNELSNVVQNVNVIKEEWFRIMGSPETIDSPETTYDIGSESWKNFWLLHSFPANVPSLTTWIDTNCNMVPKTFELIKNINGIRDAFFSHLGPGVVLDEHYGYADQSNYVLRCHIPLVLPAEPSSSSSSSSSFNYDNLCYVEVEGERRYHRMNDAIVFDDSKLHSAGNLSSNGRTVLIIDIDRPKNVSIGTSTSSISRTMLSHWSSKVYPHYTTNEINTLVKERIPFCGHFLEEKKDDVNDSMEVEGEI